MGRRKEGIGKMRVLVTDLASRMNVFGGQARIASILSTRLGKGFECEYLGYKTQYIRGRKGDMILKRGVINPSSRNSALSESKLIRIAYNIAVVSRLGGMEKERLIDNVKKFGPEVIICNSVVDFPLLKALKRGGMKFKSVYIDHGSVSTNSGGFLSNEGIPLAFGTGIRSISMESIKRRFFGFFDMNVALNMSQYGSIRRLTDKVVLINNGLDIKAGRKDPSARGRYGLSGNDFVVSYIGRMFERQKRVSTLIEAFLGIKGKGFRLLMVGDGPSLGSYREMSKDDNRIIFTGRMEDRDLNRIYKSIDVMVLPSRWEGLPLTILEASSYSVPIIFSRSAYIKDLRKPSINGQLCFPDGDSNELRRMILKLTDPEKHAAAVAASRSISRTFTESSMINRYRQVLARL